MATHSQATATTIRHRTPRVPSRLRFVVQEHHTQFPHYDLRLEIDGVLKSWALPKGPTLDPDVRRLAVRVHDHPLDQLGFAGWVPPGQPGAGMVYIWDEGVYAPAKYADLAADLERGLLAFVLAGSILRGGFALQRVSLDSSYWLLTKTRDRYANAGWVLRPQEAHPPPLTAHAQEPVVPVKKEATCSFAIS